MHHAPQYDYHDYDTSLQSGPEFLDDVSEILGGSELAGIPPHITNGLLGGTLLQNIQHKVRSELSRGPPSHVRSHVQIGIAPPAAVLPPQPVEFNRNVLYKHRNRPRNRLPHIPYSSSSRAHVATKKVDSEKITKAVKSIKGDPNSVSFSELMADFLVSNPLPSQFMNDKKDSERQDVKTKKGAKKKVFVPFRK